MDDDKLLREFADHRSEEAFRALVDRHLDFVYSVALRRLGNPQSAEEVAQLVFIDLAAKAPRLDRNTVLAGWLYRATCFAAGKAVRSELRRQRRETRAAQMETSNHPNNTDPSWERLEPLLDEALGQLPELDRNVVLLRFFEKKALRDVATQVGLNEGAARKRLARAVEKLRAAFVRRGVAVSSVALAATLLAQTAPAAPVGLAAAIAGTAAQGALLGGSTLTIGNGILKIMALSKLKLAATATIAVLMVTGTTYVIQHRVREPVASSVETDDDAMILRIIRQMNSRALDEAPPRVFLRASGTDDRRTGTISANGKFMGRGVSVAELLAMAYRTSRGRLRPLDGVALPDGRFDYLVSLASGQREALQQLIRERLGLTAQAGTREEDVYVLTARTGEFDNLRPTEGNRGGMRMTDNAGELNFQNATIDAFARSLEQLLPLPVVDESGLRGRFDILLHWPAPDEGTGRKPSAEIIQQAALEQLGLDLQPTKRELEVLLVESGKSR